MSAGLPGVAYRATVTAVSEDLDRPFWIKASWPAVGGEHPDFIRPRLGLVHVMPKVGDLVDVEAMPTLPGRYQWTGIDRRGTDLPAEVQAAYPDVAVMLPANARCYVVFDDRATGGGLRLHATGGAWIRILNDGTVTVEGTAISLGAGVAADLVAQATKVMADLNALQTAFTNWVVAPGDGGAALKAILAAMIGGGWPQDVAASKVRAE